MRRTILDGYNLLLREGDPAETSMEELREEFVRRVDVARPEGETVTVVFDGRAGPSARRTWPEGLEVRYSRSPRTADDLIVSLVRAGPRGQVTVLTRDRELGRRVREAGGELGDPDAFFRPPPRRASGPPRREKPPAPRGRDLDEWERLFDEGKPSP